MREVARRSGLSIAQISRIESGSVDAPTTETVARLAAALGRDPRILFVALGRIDGHDAVRIVRNALQSPSVDAGLSALGDEMGKSEESILFLQGQRSALSKEWQALAGRSDDLEAEAHLLFQTLQGLEKAAAENHERPNVAAECLGAAHEVRQRLERVRSDRAASHRYAEDVQRELKKQEPVLREEERRLADTVREAAGKLFVSTAGAATSPSSLIAEMSESASGSDEQALRYLDALVSSTERSRLVRALEESLAGSSKKAISHRHLYDAMEESQKRLSELTRDLADKLAHEPSDMDSRRLVASWNRLTPERRKRVLEFVEDQRLLSMQEQLSQPEEVAAIEEAASHREKSS